MRKQGWAGFVERYAACAETCSARRYIREQAECRAAQGRATRRAGKRVLLRVGELDLFERLWVEAQADRDRFPPHPIPVSSWQWN